MNLLPTVLAHTGNDVVNHGFELADGIIGVLMIFIIGMISIYLIKKRREN